MRSLDSEGQLARDPHYDSLCASLTHQEVATRLASEQLADGPFNAYRPPLYMDPPNSINSKTSTLVLGSLGFFPALMLAWGAIEKQEYGAAAVIAIIGLCFYAFVYGCFLLSDSNAQYKYKTISENYEKWDNLSSLYFASARKLLTQNIQPQEVLHDTYRPRPGETLFLVNRTALFAFRDRVVSRSQVGGMVSQESETLGHFEGVGLLAVTSKGINFISDDHRSNIFMRWKDIAMTSTDSRFFVVQPYSGKVRHFVFEKAGVNPASDPIVNNLYIENVRDMFDG